MARSSASALGWGDMSGHDHRLDRLRPVHDVDGLAFLVIDLGRASCPARSLAVPVVEGALPRAAAISSMLVLPTTSSLALFGLNHVWWKRRRSPVVSALDALRRAGAGEGQCEYGWSLAVHELRHHPERHGHGVGPNSCWMLASRLAVAAARSRLSGNDGLSTTSANTVHGRARGSPSARTW